MCTECGCGLDTGLTCPECGGRMVLVNNQATCLECGATPPVDEYPSVHDEGHHHQHHPTGHANEEEAKRNDLTKLRVLLPHWIEHNAEHAESFYSWAERARAAGAEHLAAHIEEAAGKIAAANRDLEDVLKHIGAVASEHGYLAHHRSR